MSSQLHFEDPSLAKPLRLEGYGGQSGTGTGFSPSTAVSPLNIIHPVLHTPIYFAYYRHYVTLQTDSVVK